MLIRADFVHCPTLGCIEICHDYVLVVNDEGFIKYFSTASSSESARILSASLETTVISEGSFLLPTFCDLHLHAPQFLYQGTGLHLPLMSWLAEYAFKSEEQLDANPALAANVYRRLAERLVENGTGAVLLFGTIKAETNLILAREMLSIGIRAFVGKLSMNISSLPSYVEASTSLSIDSLHSFISNVRAMTAHLPPHRQLVEPVITPRFVPSCSDDLLSELGKLLKNEYKDLRLQSHMAEAEDQIKWVRSERGVEDIEVFDRHGLLTPSTIQAHCTYLEQSDLHLVHSHGTAIAHCPLSNAYFSGKPFPLREALLAGVKVGLGTDVAGGYSISIADSMRAAVFVSRMREGQRNSRNVSGDIETTGEQDSEQIKLEKSTTKVSIDWKEALYLATRGGALALGLPTGTGIFEIGAPFDAQCIRVRDLDTSMGTGALDFFDLQNEPPYSESPHSSAESPQHEQHHTGSQRSPWIPRLSEEAIEKWWCMGDVRNRDGVWVQGNRIYPCRGG